MSRDLRFDLSDGLFVAAIRSVADEQKRTVLIGLCGPQGSGKSTTAARVKAKLDQLGHSVALLSLDDFYLPRASRAALARAVHPLFVTRGVPGTHDVALIEASLDSLAAAGEDRWTPLPSFDKAADERRPPSCWSKYQGRPDIILWEGWCVGAQPQTASELQKPINRLEEEEDGAAVWRTHVNAALATDYARVFARLDLRIMLRPPSFDCVQGWRAEQEAGLDRTASEARPPMDSAALARFISHYERITRALIELAPADLLADIDEDRVPRSWTAGYHRAMGSA